MLRVLGRAEQRRPVHVCFIGDGHAAEDEDARSRVDGVEIRDDGFDASEDALGDKNAKPGS